MSAAQTLLSRLNRVGKAGEQWRASCPTHAHTRGDKSRGLYIRQIDDRVLIKCHAGCSADEILEAVGLTLADLFDRPAGNEPRQRLPAQQRWDWRALLAQLDAETKMVRTIAEQVASGQAVNADGLDRLQQAAKRIEAIRRAAND